MVGTNEFEMFFRAEFPRLVLYLRLRGYEQYAADAAQEALTAAFRCWHKIDAPSAWARSAALRIAQREARRESERTYRDRFYAERNPTLEPLDPVRAAELTEEHRVILKKMEALPVMRRTVIALTIVGYSTEFCRWFETCPLSTRGLRGHRACPQPRGLPASGSPLGAHRLPDVFASWRVVRCLTTP